MRMGGEGGKAASRNAACRSCPGSVPWSRAEASLQEFTGMLLGPAPVRERGGIGQRRS